MRPAVRRGAVYVVGHPAGERGRRAENVTRVETFGDHTFGTRPEWDTNDVHWVKALIDPQSP